MQLAILVLAAILCCVDNAYALSTVDRGWYEADGVHHPDNVNYFVGDGQGPIHRNFFVFDLSLLTAPLSEAILYLWNPPGLGPSGGFGGSDLEETYRLYDFTGSVQNLLDGTGGVEAWEDLGTGVQYGEVVVTASAVGKFISITLNSDAVAAINASSGLFVIGGAITTLDGVAGNLEFLFGSSSADSQTFLAPEPTSGLLLAAGLLGLAAINRRRSRGQQLARPG